MTTALQATTVAATPGNVTEPNRLPLAVLAAEVDGRMMCVVIDSFFDESLAPGLVSVRIPADHPSWETLRKASSLGISVLNPLQTLAVGKFTQARPGAVPEALRADRQGAGVVHGAAVQLTTRLYQEFDAGSHTVALLHVTGRTIGAGTEADGRLSLAA